MSLAKHCPRRHDGICRLTGEHDWRCPQTYQSVVPQDASGHFIKGQSGHKYPLKSLKQVRKMILGELDGGIVLIRHMMVLAGIIPDPQTGVVDIPPAVKAKMALRLAEMLWGRKFEVDVTGLVTQQVDVTVSRGIDPRIEALSVDEKRALLEAMRPLQRQLSAPDGAPVTSGAVDAEFEEEKKP